MMISAGAWSAEIASWLGCHIPMGFEFGFHQHSTPGEGPRLKSQIYDIDGGFVIAPMEKDIRVTSGVEITDLDAPPNYQQINRSGELARQAYDMKKPIGD